MNNEEKALEEIKRALGIADSAITNQQEQLAKKLLDAIKNNKFLGQQSISSGTSSIYYKVVEPNRGEPVEVYCKNRFDKNWKLVFKYEDDRSSGRQRNRCSLARAVRIALNSAR